MINKMLSGHLGAVTEQVNDLLAEGWFVRPGAMALAYHPDQRCMVMSVVLFRDREPQRPIDSSTIVGMQGETL